MATFKLVSRQYHAAAISRAKAETPRVHVVSVDATAKKGDYNVTGRKGDVYRVSFFKNESGCFATCSCQSTSRRGCYHPFACLPHFRLAVGDCGQDGPVPSWEPRPEPTTPDTDPDEERKAMIARGLKAVDDLFGPAPVMPVRRRRMPVPVCEEM